MPLHPRSLSSLVLTAAFLAWGVAPPALAPGWTGRVREALRADHRNSSDTERMERGYYESLARAGRRLDQVAIARPEPPPTDFGPLTLPVADVREYVLKPKVSARHRGATWTTNSRGMRDREYPIDNLEDAYRIALAGDSIGAGWGVDDGRGFEPTWERVLNRRSKVEVWNHAVPGLAPGQRWEHFTREGWASKPDLVVFQGTPADFGWDDRKLRSLLPKGIGWDVASYREGLSIANAQAGGDEESYKKTLRPHRETILAGVYRTVVDDCRSRGVASVWLLLPRVGKPTPQADRARLVELARVAGFSRVIDLSDAFDGLDPKTLAIAPDDFHPNALGHARLADRIDDYVREDTNMRMKLRRPHDSGRPSGDDPR
jgi:GDSL-like Lipase/Acylhydrolase family